MKTTIKSRRIITPDRIHDGFVTFEDGKILSVSGRKPDSDEYIDVGYDYLSPGFIDIHTHGGAGHDFSGSVNDVIAGVDFHLSHGTTSICPTISAAPFDVMKSALRSVSKAKRGKKARADIIGAHLEGPYLSAAQCGAQCPDFIKNPDPEEYLPLVDEFGSDIARWTYAPENDPDGAFARFLSEHRIVASAGHTNAVGDEMNTAADNGCKLITHLYSCTSTVTRDHGFRRLGVIETAFLRDDIYVEIIADGKHLPPDLIRMILKIKGYDKVALVTDSLSLAGTDIKRGRMMATDFIIEDGVCKLLDRSAFAGSIATSDRLVRVVTEEAGVDIVNAVRMMSYVPARIMGLSKGAIASGLDADFVVFGDRIEIKRVFAGGVEVYRNPAEKLR